MANQLLVIHERLGVWVRHLRPRLVDRAIRLVETRSATDLDRVLAGSSNACPIVLIDLARRPRAGLEDLDRVARAAPNALTLVLDPDSHEGVALLARELGATHVMAGPVTPPAVFQILARWIPLARQRTEAAGWSGSVQEPPEPEPWNWLAPYLAVNPVPPR